MSDVVDRAWQQGEMLLNWQIKQAQSRTAHATHGVSAKVCIDCDEVIPEPRRQKVVGCIRCIDCQTIHEKTQHRQRG